jgi:hypothetical protein
MPVTAKLSQKFYQTFGDEIANELVAWFNEVDVTYRADLRELNELNFSRFDAKLEQRLAEQDVRWERRFAELDTKWERRFAGLDAKIDRVGTVLDAKIDRVAAELDAKMAAGFTLVGERLAVFKADLIKWMVALWLGTTAAWIGAMVALTKLL